MKCEICNKNVNGTKGLSIHLNKNHKFSNEEIKEYYDKYLKKKDEGNCYFCESPSIFFNLTRGYHRICDSKECLGKTRATGTPEFIEYKYGLSKEDSINLTELKSFIRGEKIKESLDNRLKENPNFHKEKSHQTKEYWLKRGYNEEESLNKSKIVMNDIHIKTWDKRRNFPELYFDSNSTRIEYWLKEGYSEKESSIKLSERQSTFSLEKCVEKYGNKIGLNIFKNRQLKWKNSLIDGGNLKCGYSKISQELFYKILETYNIENREDVYFASKNKEYYISIKGGIFYQYDFVDLRNNKIIEYNGDLYHANPNVYKIGDTPHPFRKNETFEYLRKKDENKIEAARNRGFEVLTIWDSEYNKNKEKTIEKCVNFLNS